MASTVTWPESSGCFPVGTTERMHHWQSQVFSVEDPLHGLHGHLT
jgi:hypothetical protein